MMKLRYIFSVSALLLMLSACAQSQFSALEQQQISIEDPQLFEKSDAFTIDFAAMRDKDYSFPLPVGKAKMGKDYNVEIETQKGDAVKAYLTTYGGAILTEQDEVYLFLNGDTEGYQTPTLFCSGYTDLEIYSDTVYLLSGKDEFGYMTVDSPGDFHILAENVRKFRFAVNNQNHVVAFLLMNDNRLYVYDTNESFNPDAEHFKNITDFDYCSKSTEFKVLCIQDSLCDVYYYVLSEEELSYEAIQTHSGEKTGENVAKITAYGTGVAMLDDDNNLYLYGGDMDRHYSREFTGEKVMANVSLVAGSSDSLFVVKTDGSYHYYGNNGDNTYNTIRKEE